MVYFVPLCWYISWLLIMKYLYFPKANILILVATMFVWVPVYNATWEDNKLRSDQMLLMQLYINILHNEGGCLGPCDWPRGLMRNAVDQDWTFSVVTFYNCLVEVFRVLSFVYQEGPYEYARWPQYILLDYSKCPLAAIW